MYEAAWSSPQPLARGFLIQIPFLKTPGSRQVSLQRPGDSAFPASHVDPFCGSHPLDRSAFLLAFGEGVPPEPAVTSGLPAPSPGSLKSRAHPWITLLHQAPLGASTPLSFTVFPAERQSVLPPPGRARGRWVSQAVHHAFFQQQ